VGHHPSEPLQFQLAEASGYDVVTTASQKNFDYVRRLGAEPFSYSDANAVDNIVAYLKARMS